MRRPLLTLLAAAGWAAAALARGDEVARIVPQGPPGVCTVATWRADWPGCDFEDGVVEGRLSVVASAAGLAYRVDYAPHEIGPERGGVGWRFPVPRAEALELAYTVTFSRDFDWVKGGKLPGLGGGPENVTGGRPATGANGFSARLMWRADGRGEAYVYHLHQPEKYGESLPFPRDFRFPTDTPVRVRLRIGMNAPGRRDGRLDVWVRPGDAAEEHVVSRADMEWRTVADIGVDSVLFQTFHGGGDRSWAPTRPCSTCYEEIIVSR